MNAKKPIAALLEKEMSRKQFLQVVAGAVVSVVGLPGIVGLLTKSQDKPADSSPGYGKGGYGP